MKSFISKWNFGKEKAFDSFKEIEKGEIKDLVYEFLKRIIDNPKTIRKISHEFEDEMCLERGTGLSIFKYLIINKVIEIDMTQKIDVNKNIPIINVEKSSIMKLEAI